MAMNRASISGNLTRDPELKALPTGTMVLNFSVAVNERRKRGDEWEDYPNYIDCVVYGKRAESLGKYLRKGTKIALEGRLHQDRWEKDGSRHSKIGIVVDEIEFMSRDSGDDRPKASAPRSSTPPAEDMYDDDIPF